MGLYAGHHFGVGTWRPGRYTDARDVGWGVEDFRSTQELQFVGTDTCRPGRVVAILCERKYG